MGVDGARVTGTIVGCIDGAYVGASEHDLPKLILKYTTRTSAEAFL